jgi:uncharacterized membrane protein
VAALARGPAAASAADPCERNDPPLLSLTLRPSRSLTASAGSWTLGLAAGGLGMPLVMVADSGVAWGMLPFLAGPLAALYWAFRRSTLDGRQLREELRLWPDLISVVHWDAGGSIRRWHANPFWVRLRLFDDARIEKYLTLQGNGREIELGAFLSPWERETLYASLSEALAGLRR